MIFLPLTNNPEEDFNITIFGIIYNFRQLWNEFGFWILDIRDSDGANLVLGVKIITQNNLLSQFPHIPFDLLSAEGLDPVRNNLDVFPLEVINKDV